MKDKTIEAAREMIDMLATQDDTHPPVDPKRHPLQYMFQSVWHRFQKVNNTSRYSIHKSLNLTNLVLRLQRNPSPGKVVSIRAQQHDTNSREHRT